ncbi:DUF676 domain containing protein, hydrolase-like protein [Niveomyces insectorum RCEF 264]|uniref:DUF676 domain containing protein, hydrolase-like protein n=1 Tax=Niveomyces insectorum RCEF 264 TaxID=1081102 RepID=A0A167ZBL4_9HYPO|nr:DUF676 domain containing protein, hydrolase-like protein [Niveomyces insectorum RCEF 264]
MAEHNGGSLKADHLCVLVHGLWGKPGHMGSIAAALRDEFSEDRLHLLVAESNSGYFTYDGIETGGERVCIEIENALAAVEARGGHIARISVIGYSLGGLVARYAVGLLHAKGVLDKLECMNFTAFASPFLGARSPLRGFTNTFFNVMGARTLSMSGRQLFGIDKFRDTGRPLLAVLADPDSVFMAGLARFRRRTLYANIVNDRTAVHYTTAVSRTDPYGACLAEGGDLEDLPLNFVPGYGDVVLDPDTPISALPASASSASLSSSLSSSSSSSGLPAGTKVGSSKGPMSVEKALRVFMAKPWSKEARTALLDVAPIFVFVCLLPVGVTVYLIHAVYQSFKSSRRRQLHEGGLAGIDYETFRVLPLWMKGLRGAVEDAYTNINGAHDPEFLTDEDTAALDDTGSSESDESGSIAQAHAAESNQGGSNGYQQTTTTAQQQQQQEQRQEKPAHGSHDAQDADHPHGKILALSPEQFAMIDALDALGWRKYPVWIHNVRHSHAAIIVRHESPRFDEGKLVLRHFVKEEFLIA